jgi:DNA-directed RNA polymerase specialized sigma24 family protein
MSNPPDVATAGSEKPPSPVLTDAQVSEFWNGIIANGDAARRMAEHFVPKHDAEDVVHSAAIQFLEALQRPVKPAQFPKSDDEFRRRFLLIIRNHALDCVREPEAPERSDLFNWGVFTEPTVGGRKSPDRPLDHVFARNDTGHYDAAIEDQMRPQDNIDTLFQILWRAVAHLPKMQAAIITETFFEGRKRAEVSRRHGISVKTYDNTLQAAFLSLGYDLRDESEIRGEAERSIWYNRIDKMYSRREAMRKQRRLAKMRADRKAREDAIAAERDRVKKRGAGAA